MKEKRKKAKIKPATIKPGIYKHYKGGKYRIHYIVFHSETLDPMVLYEHLEDGKFWVRPLRMFREYVKIQGKRVKRFVRISGEKA